MTAGSKHLSEESPSVQAHLTLLQGVVQRMATNSASCKAWCITLVSAILVVVADKAKAQYAFIALVPVLLFLALDAYYLGLELTFRNAYTAFVRKLHHENLEPADLYVIGPTKDVAKGMLRAVLSFSVWPFYGTLLVMVWLTKALVL
jgi:hypothetical protein